MPTCAWLSRTGLFSKGREQSIADLLPTLGCSFKIHVRPTRPFLSNTRRLTCAGPNRKVRAAAHRQSRLDLLADQVIGKRGCCDGMGSSLQHGERVGDEEGSERSIGLVRKDDGDWLTALQFNDGIVGIREPPIQLARRNTERDLFVTGKHDGMCGDIIEPCFP